MTTDDKPDDRAHILQQLDGQWQKIAAFLVWRFSRNNPVIISHQDFARMAAYMTEGDRHLLTWGHLDSIELRLMTREDAEKLAKHIEDMGGTVGRPT